MLDPYHQHAMKIRALFSGRLISAGLRGGTVVKCLARTQGRQVLLVSQAVDKISERVG